MAEPKCHYCTRVAEAECPTCGRFYCGEHGEDVCLRCLAPESATPSVAIFRGSVVALGIASLVAVFLLVRPPESKGSGDTARIIATASPVVTVTATPTRTVTQSANSSATAAATPSSVAGGTTPAPSVTGTPAAADKTYTVRAGDTLSGIAAQSGTTVDALLAANPGVTAETLQIGAVLKLP